MNGLVKVTPESLISLTDDCCTYMRKFKLEDCEQQIYKTWSWIAFGWIEGFSYKSPFWYGYKNRLNKHMHELHDVADQALNTGDEIWLSELSYKNMVLLKNGNEDANPIYIMNY